MARIPDSPIADIFPLMPEAEIRMLADDIKKNGQQTPIILLDGKILDGRNRYRACVMIGVEPKTQEYKGKDPLTSVISWNLHRRHLNESQRAMVAARLANLEHGANQHKTGCLNLSILPVSQPEAAEKLNVSRSMVQAAKAIQRDAPEKAKEIERGEKTVNQVKREIAKAKITATVAKKLDGKYRVIYADPPWKYGDKLTEGYGPAEYHYPTMTIPELCLLPIREISEENAVLFLWVTSPLLEDGFEIINARGFKYKTSFVWDKVKHNMGHYNSVRHEFLLVCTRGSCTPDVPKLFDSVVSVERKEHSEKPEELREIIDTLYPHGKRVELFARKKTKGWDVWGNQA